MIFFFQDLFTKLFGSVRGGPSCRREKWRHIKSRRELAGNTSSTRSAGRPCPPHNATPAQPCSAPQISIQWLADDTAPGKTNPILHLYSPLPIIYLRVCAACCCCCCCCARRDKQNNGLGDVLQSVGAARRRPCQGQAPRRRRQH